MPNQRPDDMTAGTFRTPGAVFPQLIGPPIGTTAAPPAPAPAAVCPTCHGATYLRRDVPVGHPGFGELVACTCRLAAQTQQDQADLYALSNLGSYRSRTFDMFQPRPELTAARAAAQTFADRPQGWLVLCGGYGVGKTHLAGAIANATLTNGTRTYFAVVPDLLDHLRATFAPTSAVAFDDRFEMIRTIELLILDDLGTENPTSWVREKMYQLINHRWIAGLPTVITTNVPFERMDPRIVSRLRDQDLCQVLVITARDYRQRSQQGTDWTARPPANPSPGERHS